METRGANRLTRCGPHWTTSSQPRQSHCRLNGSAVFITSFSNQRNSHITQVFPFLFSAKE
jgi:hypothetical protein